MAEYIAGLAGFHHAFPIYYIILFPVSASNTKKYVYCHGGKNKSIILLSRGIVYKDTKNPVTEYTGIRLLLLMICLVFNYAVYAAATKNGLVGSEYILVIIIIYDTTSHPR